jgi:hypothetical protein
MHVTSAYMAALSEQLLIYGSVIARFPNSQLVRTRNKTLATRIATFFIRHAALLRPLSTAGASKLAVDMAQLEMALASIHPVKELGLPYRELRALRQLFFRFSSHSPPPPSSRCVH